MSVYDRLMRGELELPQERANRLALANEPEDFTLLKQRVGLTDYIALPGGSIFAWVKEGLSSTTKYIMDVAQAKELIGAVNAAAQMLVDAHIKIKQLSGPAAKNAKSHWTKYAYRQQQIVNAINQSVKVTEKVSGRMGRQVRDTLATEVTSDRGLGIALETGIIIGVTVIGAIAAIGFFVAVGWVITSIAKQIVDLKMYQEDIDLTIATGKASGKVAERARKADPIIGGLDEFFNIFNWKAALAVVGVGGAALLAYYYLKTKVTTPGSSYRQFPQVHEEFPEELLSD